MAPQLMASKSESFRTCKEYARGGVAFMLIEEACLKSLVMCTAQVLHKIINEFTNLSPALEVIKDFLLPLCLFSLLSSDFVLRTLIKSMLCCSTLSTLYHFIRHYNHQMVESMIVGLFHPG